MLDETALQRTFAHVMELWFEPEVRRRQVTGAAPKPYPLRAAQVILYADGRANEIRLNEEVQALGKMKLKDGVVKTMGDPVYIDEIEEIPAIHLPSSEDPNCGHFTLVLIGDRWYSAFDFRYNKGKASQLLEAAEEFFTTASEALGAGRKRPAIDNLFSAAELAAKAYVITTPFPGDKGRKKHGHVQARFNLLTRHGNLETGHRTTFNALSECRGRARYLDGVLDETTEDISKWKVDVEGLIEAVRIRVAVPVVPAGNGPEEV